MLKKFLNGQTVSGMTPAGRPFSGYISIKENRKVVVNEDRKWVPLEKLTKVRLTGRLLHEDLEGSIGAIVSKLDTKKLSKASDTDREKLKKAIVGQLGDEAKKNEDDVNSSIDAAIMKSQAASGTSSDTKILQDYIDEKAALTEATVEMDAVTDVDPMTLEGFDFSTVIDGSLYDPYQESFDLVFNAIQPYVDSMPSNELVDVAISQGVNLPREEIEAIVSDMLGDSDPASENFMIDASYEVAPPDAPITEEACEQALDDYYETTEKPTDEGLYQFVCERFDFDPELSKKALRECSGSVVDAICRLAETKGHLTEASTNQLVAFIRKNFNDGNNPGTAKDGTFLIPEDNLLLSLSNPGVIYGKIKQMVAQSENGTVSDPEGFLGAAEAATKVVNTVITTTSVNTKAYGQIKFGAFVNRLPSTQRDRIKKILESTKNALAIAIQQNEALIAALNAGDKEQSLSKVYAQLFSA